MAKILIIDDDVTLQKLFLQLLTDQGHEILLAENGIVGMQHVGDWGPDLIITDILMPEMDGLEILLAIRKTNKEIPIIAISGGTRNMNIDFLQQANVFGANFVFRKPISLPTLSEAIETCLSKKQKKIA